MPTSKHTGGQLDISANQNTETLLKIANVQSGQLHSPALTPKQKSKQDAMDLAELIYDIFKDSLSNGKIIGSNGEDPQNVH